MRPAVMLVVAKAPVAGRVKTRLGHVLGMERAAELAAAALLDTLAVCVAAYGVDRCHLALDGDLAEAERADELLDATSGWIVHPQRGDDFATGWSAPTTTPPTPRGHRSSRSAWTPRTSRRAR